MREHVRAFCRLAVQCFPLEGPVFEFGSLQVEGQEDRANLRSLFAGQSYVGCDMRPGNGVDRIEDLAALSLADAEAGTVLCFDTLEHTFEVQQACREMFRVLRPGGMLVVSVPFHFRIHAYPDDYWRLTPSCLLRLLDPFGAVLLATQGAPKLPHTVLALAAKGPVGAEFFTCAHQLADAYRDWLDERQSFTGLVEHWRERASLLLRTKGERARRRSRNQVEFHIHRAGDPPTTGRNGHIPRRSREALAALSHASSNGGGC